MERLTDKKTKKLLVGTDEDKAIEKLVKFENLYEEVVNSQKTISDQLEVLRQADKQKTVQFRELMIKKLNNTNFIVTFEMFDIN